ncbi:transporter substrate-binding domain-containing protein [Roseovarius atlanticus]|uniref:transporter substrate-binding domain-containing protein n=1 Tax=Roseovarius atlanticus TaxID=1641875 RepID=UPI0021BD3D0B|nr:transporter substrate-binding domain-containing protein [Roseovarius atlanticus]
MTRIGSAGLFAFEGLMRPLKIRIGLLFSESGSYSAVSRAMSAGARLAIAEINNRHADEIQLEQVPFDPKGNLRGYVEGAQYLLGELGLKHVVGCYTSSSRKEVLPYFEKHDAMLWYPSHYEGFETAENVVYTGAAPNQHILPLARHLLREDRRRGWLVGSNYIWAWENNRILREALTNTQGEVVGERYFPVGETDLSDVVKQIVADVPDFVFTTLIGSSLVSFIRELRAEAEAAGIDQTRKFPVCSCSLSEAELPFLGNASDGHLSSSVYFSSILTSENKRFTSAWDAKFGQFGRASADAEATYLGVHLLAEAAMRAGSDAFEPVREAVRGARFSGPQGDIRVDEDNLHCWMRPRIGRSRPDGTFDVLFENPVSIRPDPYLTWTSEGGEDQNTDLKVVT